MRTQVCPTTPEGEQQSQKSAEHTVLVKLRDVRSPTALKMKMKTSVHDTRPVSQAHLDLSTAEIPKKMKIMVSAMLARVFIVYLTVVRDFWEMLASTYLLAPIPQKVILGGGGQQ